MLIISEFGSSPAAHNWDFARWCEGAAAAGAGAVKVQLFKAEHFPEGEQDSKRPLEFPRERLLEYMRAARAYGLMAGASVFDVEAVRLVARHCDFIKLAAREWGNIGLRAVAFDAAWIDRRLLFRSQSVFEFQAAGETVTPMFAIQKYPAGMVESVYTLLLAAAFFKARRSRWGWSSHTKGDLDCIMAKRLGATVLEKHFALGSSDLEAGHSLLPPAFSRMVEKCR